MLRGLQEIYKDTDYRSVAQSVVKTAMALTESMAFVLAQLTLEGQRAAESVVQLKEDLAKQRHENGRLTMQVAFAFGVRNTKLAWQRIISSSVTLPVSLRHFLLRAS